MPLKSEFREVNRACWVLDHNTRLDLRHELFLWDVGLHPSSNPSPNPPVYLPILCCCFLDRGLLCTIALGHIQKREALTLLFSLVMIFFMEEEGVFGHKNVLEIWWLLLGFRLGFFFFWIDVLRMKLSVSGVPPSFILLLWQTTFLTDGVIANVGPKQ